jgi:hypothetical protein
MSKYTKESGASTEGDPLQCNEDAMLKMLNERMSGQLREKCEALEEERGKHWKTEQKLANVRCIAGKYRVQHKAILPEVDDTERQLWLDSMADVLRHLSLLNERLSGQLSDKNMSLREERAKLWEAGKKLADIRRIAGKYHKQRKAALPEVETTQQQLWLEGIEDAFRHVSKLKETLLIQLKGKDDALKRKTGALWDTERKLADVRVLAGDYRVENKRLEAEAESNLDRHNRLIEKILTELVDSKKTTKEKNDRLWSTEEKLVAVRIMTGESREKTKQLKAVVRAEKAKVDRMSMEMNNTESALALAEETVSNEADKVHDLGLHLHALSILMSMDDNDERGVDGDNNAEDSIVLEPIEAIGDALRSEQHNMIMGHIENDVRLEHQQANFHKYPSSPPDLNFLSQFHPHQLKQDRFRSLPPSPSPSASPPASTLRSSPSTISSHNQYHPSLPSNPTPLSNSNSISIPSLKMTRRGKKSANKKGPKQSATTASASSASYPKLHAATATDVMATPLQSPAIGTYNRRATRRS